MRIITLGTSHGDTTPFRFNSSVAYETVDGRLYLIDAGAPVEALLRRQGLCLYDLRAVFISHMHDDHAGGLTGLMKQTTKYPKDRPYPLSIYLPEEAAIEPLKLWFAAVHEKPDSPLLEYHAVNDGLVFEDEYIRVSAIRTCHLRTKGRNEGDPCSFAYDLFFKKENLRVLHTSDLSASHTDFPAVAKEEYFDVCITEAVHQKPEVTMDNLMHSKFGQLIFTHLGNRWQINVGGKWEVQNGERALLETYRDLPYPVRIAHDGDIFWF